jgi:hypothetical protein
LDSELGAAPEAMSAGPSVEESADVGDDFVLATDPDWQPTDDDGCMLFLRDQRVLVDGCMF